MSEYDDQYREFEGQLYRFCNTLPVYNNKHRVLTYIGDLSLSLESLQKQADECAKARFPWCLGATWTSRQSNTGGAFRPTALEPAQPSYNNRWMIPAKERKRYSHHYRCPCDNDDYMYWHKLTCVVTYDDWGNGPECNLCGEIKENHNE